MLFSVFALAHLLVVVVTQTVTYQTPCVCGYRDPVTHQLSTDALIVYFNETDVIDPDVFSVEDYAHKKEQGCKSSPQLGRARQALMTLNT